MAAQEHGAALFSYGDFGAIDLDTLETSALPWPVLAASLALHEAQGAPVAWPLVERAFKRFGFLYPETLAGLSSAMPVQGVPLGFSVGTLTRSMPPLRMDVLNIGCAACHAGPVYGADGAPDVTKAVPGMPNTSLDLEAFTATAYAALKRALADEPGLMAAMERLFPQMGLREKLTLRWLAIPRGKDAVAKLQASIDRPLPFPNGVPGSTNGVAALKHRLHVTARDRFNDGAAVYRAGRFYAPYLRMDAGGLTRRLTSLATNNIRPRIHAVGNHAAACACQALADAGARNATLEHLTFLGEREIDAVAATGAVASLQPGFIERFGSGILDRRLVPDLRAYAAASLLRAGVPLALSSDNPCGPLDPLHNIRMAVERRIADGRVVDAREAITVEQAVAAYTTGGFQAIHGVAGGGLGVGAPADFVIVDAHPMSARCRVVETWIGGRLAWSGAA